MNEPYRLRYANQIVGAFLLVILLIGLVLTALLLRAGDYFVERDIYWFEIDQSELQDLRKGVEVMMLGERVGQIESIGYVGDSERVRVNLAIEPDKSPLIYENSVLVPDRKFGLGTPILYIRRGDVAMAEPRPLPPGSQIKSYQSESDRIDQMAREVEMVSNSVLKIQQKLDPTLTSIDSAAIELRDSISQSMNPALTEAQSAAESFRETNSAVRPEAVETMQAIRVATADLQSQIGTLSAKIQTLIDEDMRDTLAKVQDSTGEVGKAAQRVGETSEEVNERIADTLVTLEKAAKSVQTLAEETREVVKIVRREADDLPGTTARVNDTVGDTQDLVEEVRGHWLLRNSSSRNRSTPAISPSGVRSGMAR